MSMNSFHAATITRIVKPKGDPIFSEMATTIEIQNEAAGSFVAVKQPGGRLDKDGVLIGADEWPFIRREIDRLLRIGESLDRLENEAEAENREIKKNAEIQ